MVAFRHTSPEDLLAPASGDHGVKVRQVVRLLERDGWVLVVTRGSHRQFKHPVKPGRVTVSGSMGDDMPKGTLASVLRQAQLKENPR